jgi:serine protease Do
VTPDIQASSNLSVDHGFLISGFTDDATGKSPAKAAGLQTGDVIIDVNGTTINGSGDLSGVLLQLAPGTKVTVKVQRGSSQVSVSVTLGERPANANG